MRVTSKTVLRTYITLTLLSTFAASFIWGINTLFLLDAGLTITEAFTANALFTLGQVIFEIPTGVVADTAGRRFSYLLGSATLFVSTIMYLVLWQQHAPFAMWIAPSILLGLGFTFFSGAVEAWLVDALKSTEYKANLESAFAKGQVAQGIAMLSGAAAGGVVAQFSNLGVPYILRAVMLAATFIVTLILMRDIGFKPRKHTGVIKEVKYTLKSSFDHGLKNPPVRWIMLMWPFLMGVGGYAFYAMQPYLLELFGNSESYAVAGLAAAIIGGAQIGGGLIVGKLRTIFSYRTSLLFAMNVIGAVVLVSVGLFANFWIVLGLIVIWAILFAAIFPVSQAYINELIPSEQRATVLSTSNLLSSAGGVVFQPALGKTADVWSFSTSYVVGGFIQLLALPFILLAKHQKAPSDPITSIQSAGK